MLIPDRRAKVTVGGHDSPKTGRFPNLALLLMFNRVAEPKSENHLQPELNDAAWTGCRDRPQRWRPVEPAGYGKGRAGIGLTQIEK